MAVKTYKQVQAEKKGAGENPPAAVSPEKKVNGKIVYKMKFPVDVKGVSTAFYFDKNGNEKSVEMIDGVHIVEERGNLRDEKIMELKRAGFIDVREFEGTPVLEEKESKIKIYTLFHPDHTEGNPINAETEITRKNGDAAKIIIENGIAKTTYQDVRDELLSMGFMTVSEKDVTGEEVK